MRVTDYSATYGASVQKLLEANPTRLWVGISNQTTGNLYVGLQQITSTKGLHVVEPGGYIVFAGPTYWAGEIWIRPLSTGSLLIEEVSL